MSITKNLAYNSGSHIARMFLPLFTFPILAREFSDFDMAQYIIGMMIANMAASLIEYGYGISAVQEIAARKKSEHTIDIIQRVESGKSLIAVPISMLAAMYLHAKDFTLIQISIITLSGVISGITPHYLHIGNGSFKKLALTELLANALFSTFAITSVLLHGEILYVFIGYLLSRILVFLVLRIKMGVFEWELTAGINSLKDNSIYFIHRISQTILLNSPVLLLSLTGNHFGIIVYSFAEKIVSALVGMFQPILQVFIQYLSKNNILKNHVETDKIYSILLSGFILICLTIGISATGVYSIFYGEEKKGYAWGLQILLFAAPLKVLSGYIAAKYFLSTDKKRLFSKIFIVSSAFYLGGLYLSSKGHDINKIMYFMIFYEAIYLLFLFSLAKLTSNARE